MSTENPFIPVFQGLEKLEELARGLELVVYHRPGTPPERLEFGTILHLSSIDFPRIGLRLESAWKHDAIAEALSAAGLTKEEVGIAIVAEDGFLKERKVVQTRANPYEVESELVLVESGGERPDAMKNAFRGFDLSVHLYLSEGKEPEPYRPHRKGTILASATFKVRPRRSHGGIDPKPLTQEKIEEFRLHPSSVLYINREEEVLPMREFDDSIEIYVNEAILIAASHHRGPERDVVIGGLAIEALCQLVHLVHDEISDDTEPPEDGASAILRLFRKNLKGIGVDWSEIEIFEQIKAFPNRVTALLSGIDGRSSRLLSFFSGEDE